jgi:glycosyltransferase involved in cell wall biosynthesis
VKYYWKENSGAGGARNLGTEKAQGEYITFLDDDDLLLPTAVARRVTLLDSAPQAGMAYSDLFVMNAQGETLGRYYASEGFAPFSGNLYSAILLRNYIPVHAILWRKMLLEQIGGFPDRSGAEDWDCLIRAAEQTSAVYLDEPLGYYRLHSQNITADQMARVVAGYGLVQKYIATSPRFKQVAPTLRLRALLRYAAQQWLEGDPELGRLFWRQARAVSPFHPLVLAQGGLFWLPRSLARQLGWWLWNWRAQILRRPSATAYFRRDK